jgi:hypothetical protein
MASCGWPKGDKGGEKGKKGKKGKTGDEMSPVDEKKKKKNGKDKTVGGILSQQMMKLVICVLSSDLCYLQGTLDACVDAGTTVGSLDDTFHKKCESFSYTDDKNITGYSDCTEYLGGKRAFNPCFTKLAKRFMDSQGVCYVLSQRKLSASMVVGGGMGEEEISSTVWLGYYIEYDLDGNAIIWYVEMTEHDRSYHGEGDHDWYARKEGIDHSKPVQADIRWIFANDPRIIPDLLKILADIGEDATPLINQLESSGDRE